MNLNYSKEGKIPGHLKHTDLESITIIKNQMEESVCKIYGTNKNGTGFFCAIQNTKEWDSPNLYVLITSNDILGKQDIKQDKK